MAEYGRRSHHGEGEAALVQRSGRAIPSPCERDRNRPFCGIANKDEDTQALAHRASDVRRTNISAANRAEIDPTRPSDEDAKWNRSTSEPEEA